MKDNCQMVKDLLPLYAENVASEESRNFVSAHLEECETCRNQLKELQAALPEESRKMSEEEEALFQKKVRELLRRRRRRVLRNVLFGIAIGLVLFFVFLICKSRLYDDLSAKDMETQDYQLQVVRLNNGEMVAIGKTFGNLLSGGHSMRTAKTEDGKCVLSVNVQTSILPRHGSDDTKLLFDLKHWEYDAICAGKDLDTLIWEEGQPVPAASEELETYFQLEQESKLLSAKINYLNQVNWIMGLEDTEAENWPYLQSAGEKLDELWKEMIELQEKAPEWQ